MTKFFSLPSRRYPFVVEGGRPVDHAVAAADETLFERNPAPRDLAALETFRQAPENFDKVQAIAAFAAGISRKIGFPTRRLMVKLSHYTLDHTPDFEIDDGAVVSVYVYPNPTRCKVLVLSPSRILKSTEKALKGLVAHEMRHVEQGDDNLHRIAFIQSIKHCEPFYALDEATGAYMRRQNLSREEKQLLKAEGRRCMLREYDADSGGIAYFPTTEEGFAAMREYIDISRPESETYDRYGTHPTTAARVRVAAQRALRKPEPAQ